MLKRVDRALEILERLRARDERFRLIIKGTGPWDYDWMAGREAERAFYEQALARVERSPLLGSAVLIEPFGEDVAAFLQEIGWVLSLSTVEGHAVAPAEGMASGAIPVVIDRPGAAEQYPPQWIHPDPEHAAWAILSLSANGGLGQEQALARRLAEGLDISRLTPLWGQLLRLAE
jgi:glycosyltransferase involved in cell wall biosynthesis